MCNVIQRELFIKESKMKIKERHEDFISKNLSEFRGLEYCAVCMELKTTNNWCCQGVHFVKFEEFDRETQREIVDSELRKYA